MDTFPQYLPPDFDHEADARFFEFDARVYSALKGLEPYMDTNPQDTRSIIAMYSAAENEAELNRVCAALTAFYERAKLEDAQTKAHQNRCVELQDRIIRAMKGKQILVRLVQRHVGIHSRFMLFDEAREAIRNTNDIDKLLETIGAMKNA